MQHGNFNFVCAFPVKLPQEILQLQTRLIGRMCGKIMSQYLKNIGRIISEEYF